MVQICSIQCIYKRSRSPMHIFWSSGLFLDYPDKFSEFSRHFSDHPEPSRFSRYISTASRPFLEYPDIFRLSGHFLHHMENFQIILTLHIIWIFCIVSGHFPKFFSQWWAWCKNLPDSQKLSGQQCWRADGVFATLHDNSFMLATSVINMAMSCCKNGVENMDPKPAFKSLV